MTNHAVPFTIDWPFEPSYMRTKEYRYEIFGTNSRAHALVHFSGIIMPVLCAIL